MDSEKGLQAARDAASAEYEKAVLPIQEKYDKAMAEAEAKYAPAKESEEDSDEDSA